MLFAKSRFDLFGDTSRLWSGRVCYRTIRLTATNLQRLCLESICKGVGDLAAHVADDLVIDLLQFRILQPLCLETLANERLGFAHYRVEHVDGGFDAH